MEMAAAHLVSQKFAVFQTHKVILGLVQQSVLADVLTAQHVLLTAAQLTVHHPASNQRIVDETRHTRACGRTRRIRRTTHARDVQNVGPCQPDF